MSLEKRIASDEIIGAQRVADLCAASLAQFAEECEAKTPEAFWEELYAFCKKLVKLKPDMAPVFSLANDALTALQGELKRGRSVEELKNALKAFADRSVQAAKERREKIIRYGAELIEEGDLILTHSYSTTVKELLIKAHRLGKTFEVLVSEAKPGSEGRSLQQELTRQGVEAALATPKDNYRKVFVGADRISENYFVNKVGTRGIAAAAKKRGCDFYIASGTNKFVPERLGARKSAEGGLFSNVIVVNPYFEVIPLTLVTMIVCEQGLLPPGGVGAYLKEKIHFPELYK